MHCLSTIGFLLRLHCSKILVQITRELRVTNFNGALRLVQKCHSCKIQNLNSLFEGVFCYLLGNKFLIREVVKFLEEIKHNSLCVGVTLCTKVVGKVLQFGKPLIELCKTNAILARICLSKVKVTGVFVVD